MSKTKSKPKNAPQQKAGGDCPSASCCASSDYVPYGPEWEAELMKLPKKFLIPMLRNALMDKSSLRESCVLLSKLAAPTPQFFNTLHAIAAVMIRDKFLSENAEVSHGDGNATSPTSEPTHPADTDAP